MLKMEHTLIVDSFGVEHIPKKIKNSSDIKILQRIVVIEREIVENIIVGI